MKEAPVGVFDSGLGGASVLREAVRLLPQEHFIYYGDNANAPYGERTEADITALTFACAHKLQSRGVKVILLACNTATASCIERIREELDIPVVSIEPAIKPACMAKEPGKVLMAATRATTRLARYRALQARMPQPQRIINIPCPGLVERIERGIFAPDAFDDLLGQYFAPCEGMEVSGVVLGCTHYIFIREAFARYAKAHFRGKAVLYDGNAATALQLKRVLADMDALNETGSGGVEFHTSGDASRLEPLFFDLLNRPE